ncbi:MAG: type III PLP-dependent enzyme [Gammaproteobacteria bacterium]|nr:type III PLP-dependent enzyme [Gammaproteobacteria bacterium]
MKRLTVKTIREAAPYQQLVAEHGSPLLVLDCDLLTQQYKKLSRALPGVELFYAIKSLPHPAAIDTLHQLGASFDIATSGEIELLRERRAQPRHTIHTHPIKRDRDIRDALRFGCTTFVIDNIYELEKFVDYRHRVGLLVRVSFPNPASPVDLSRKFGCRPDEVEMLLQKANALGIHVKGLSFHAGSQCPDASNHVRAIEACGEIIHRHNEQSGRSLAILDIGGGFPVEYVGDTTEVDIDRFCAPIRAALATLPEHLHIIAEPGRYLSAPSMEAVSRVMGKARRGEQVWYYLDDGLYGSYSGQLFDHALYPLTVFSDHDEREAAVIAGPTCDSIDVIAEDIELPSLNIGDLVIGHQMGAYTSASATDFNLFERATIVTINRDTESDSATNLLHLASR